MGPHPERKCKRHQSTILIAFWRTAGSKSVFLQRYLKALFQQLERILHSGGDPKMVCIFWTKFREWPLVAVKVHFGPPAQIESRVSAQPFSRNHCFCAAEIRRPIYAGPPVVTSSEGQHKENPRPTPYPGKSVQTLKHIF